MPTTRFRAPQRSEPLTDEDQRATKNFSMFLTGIAALFTRGYTGTITTAKLTGGGANGSMTFENGVLISQTPAT